MIRIKNDYLNIKLLIWQFKTMPKNVHLYDLRKDQLEENNTTKNKNDVVIKMEKILLEILKNGNSRERKSYEVIDDE